MKGVLFARIDIEILERFKELVLLKYGVLNKYLSKEVEKAIKEYLERHPATNIIMHQHGLDPKERTRARFEHLVNALEATYEADIPVYELEKFIAMTLNVQDKRTIRKYIKLLEQERIIIRQNLYIYRLGKAPEPKVGVV